MGDWYIIYIFQKLVEIGHDRSDSIAKESLFKTLNENIHQKLCFILNTTKYFLGIEVLFLSFFFHSLLFHEYSANFTVAMTHPWRVFRQLTNLPYFTGYGHYLMSVFKLCTEETELSAWPVKRGKWLFLSLGVVWCPEWLSGVHQQEYSWLMLCMGTRWDRQWCWLGVDMQ